MKNLSITLSLLLLSTPVIVFGQQVYQPLVNLPGASTPNFEAYINILYTISISLAALLAVVKIVIAGAKYMLSDVVSNKGDAIKDIQGAVLGLLLILGAVVLLNIINPDLTKTTITFEKIVTPAPTPAPQGLSVAGASNNPQSAPNTIVTNIVTTCQSEPNQTMIDNCVRNTINRLRSDCASKYGDFTESGDAVSCTLPKQVRSMSSFTTEFEAYKSTLPIGQRVNTTLSESIFEGLCTQSGGKYVDNTGAFGVNEDVCTY